MDLLKKNQDGSFSKEDVPEHEVPQKFLSGTHYFTHPGQVIPIVAPDGSIGEVEAKDAQGAFEAGARVATQEQYKKATEANSEAGIGSSAAAAGLGFARGLSAGLTDPAAVAGAYVAGGKTYAEKVRHFLAAKKEAHPYVSTAGEVVGVALPALVSGGESLAAEGGIGAGARGAGEVAAESVIPGALEAAPEVSEATEVKGVHAPSVPATAPVPAPPLPAETSAALDRLEAIHSGDQQALARARLAELGGAPPPEPAPELPPSITTPTVVPSPAPVPASSVGEAAVKTAQDISNNPLWRQSLQYTPAGAIGRAGRAAEDLASKAMEEVLGPKLSNSLAGQILTGSVKAAASGSTEMALFEVGNQISEDTLGDHDLNAQKLYGAFGHGALMGAIFGAGMGSAAAAASEAGSALLRKIAPNVSKLAGEQAIRAISGGLNSGKGIQRQYIKMLGEDGVEKLGQYVLRSGILDGAPNLETIADRIASKKEAVGNTLTDLIAGVSDAESKLNPSVQQIKERILKGEDIVDMLKYEHQYPGAIGLTEAIIDSAGNPVLNKEGLPIVRNVDSSLSRLFSTIEGLADENGKVSLGKLRDLSIEVRKSVRNWMPTDAHGAASQRVLKSIRGSLEDAIEESGEKIANSQGRTIAKEYAAAKKEYSYLRFIEKQNESALAARRANQHFSLTSKMVGGAALVSSHNPLAAGAAMIGHKVLREHGDAISALMLDKLSQTAFIQRTAAKIDRETKSAVDGIFSRAEGKAKARTRVRHFTGAGQGESPTEARDSSEKRMHEIRDLAVHPKVNGDHIGIALGGQTTQMPKTSGSLASTINVATNYLLSQLPAGAVDHSDLMYPTGNRVSDAELSEFKQKAKGATDVKGTLKDIGNGKATQPQIEAFKTVTPKVYDQLKGSIIQKMASMSTEERSKVPYQTKLEMTVVFGIPTDWSQTPNAIKELQSNDIQITQSDGRPTTQQKPGRMAPSRLKNDLSKQIMTAMQKVEGSSPGQQ